MSNSERFKQKLAQGKTGESLIATWLRRRGRFVMPVYEIELGQGKGPGLYRPIKAGIVPCELIAPDLLTFNGDGNACWIEAKHKSAFTPHRISGGTLTTGIDLRHYFDYCSLADESPWPVWLLFLHRGGFASNCPLNTPTGLFGNDLKYLRRHEHHRHANGGSAGMVYWAIDDLKKLAEISEIETASREAA